MIHALIYTGKYGSVSCLGNALGLEERLCYYGVYLTEIYSEP